MNSSLNLHKRGTARVKKKERGDKGWRKKEKFRGLGGGGWGGGWGNWEGLKKGGG